MAESPKPTSDQPSKPIVSTSVAPRAPRAASSFRNLVLAGVGLLGLIVGVLIPQDGIRPIVERWLTGSAPVAEPADEGPVAVAGGVFEVSIAAQETYGLTFSRVEELADSYTQHIAVPAFVRERPSTSNLQASSRMSGIVRKIFVQVGQSVREGDPLMELELTGDALAAAQATLLDSVKQLQIINDEINRLRPVAKEGIARKQLIEKQYEQRRMTSVVDSKRQELLIRGLSESEVSDIVEDEKLVRSVIIRVPTGIRPQEAPLALQSPDLVGSRFKVVSSSMSDDERKWVYSVESMMVSPGSVLDAGDPVSDLAYHETLLIEGQAYERDLPMLTELINSQSLVSVEVGDSDQPVVLEDLRILYMDNHVDNETQTYRFYIEVPNEVLAENIRNGDRRFRTWRFKPGQRGHVRLPQKRWDGMLIVPADAVAVEGLDHVIFRRIAVHDHFHGDLAPHSEFKKLVVKVAYKDQYTVVVDHKNQLSNKQTIATNSADMLLRAASEGAGGGGNDHGHEH